METNTFSYKSRGRRYHVATGIDSDGQFYVYLEGTNQRPVHFEYDTEKEAQKYFDDFVAAIASVEIRGQEDY